MVKNLVNILLVEDDEIDVMNVKRAFGKNNILNPLHVAENGLEALNLLQGNGVEQIPVPRIILLDLNMPKMGGIEFLKKLRMDDRFNSISVFVMTTSNEDRDKTEAYKLNVAGYILKPLSIKSFIQAVSILNNYWQLCEYPTYEK
ncbi:MAG: two-component system response regulator [Bacteroidetes bacterium 4484_276]|nr:MAG: two-component system response regulator [Bacteroidetes bacterium 4484_276]